MVIACLVESGKMMVALVLNCMLVLVIVVVDIMTGMVMMKFF